MLEESFAAFGVTDMYVPSTIAEIVEDHLALPASCGGKERLTYERVDSIVREILINAGFSDVAAHFSSRRGLQPEQESGEGESEWNRKRISNLLAGKFSLEKDELDTLAVRVGAKLKLLNFSSASDALITELGAHLNRRRKSRKAAPKTPKELLFCRDDILEEAPADLANLIAEKALSYRPVTRILPVVRVELSMLHAAAIAGPGPQTELNLFPALNKTCEKAAMLLKMIHEKIEAVSPHASGHPAHLYLTDLSTFFEKRFIPLKKPAEKRLIREILDLIEGRINSRINFPWRISIES